jgi:Ca2+:H+ antiporter
MRSPIESTPLLSSPSDVENQQPDFSLITTSTRALSAITENKQVETKYVTNDKNGTCSSRDLKIITDNEDKTRTGTTASATTTPMSSSFGRPQIQNVTNSVTVAADTVVVDDNSSQRSLYESSYVHTRKQILVQNMSSRTEKLKRAKSLSGISLRKILLLQQQQRENQTQQQQQQQQQQVNSIDAAVTTQLIAQQQPPNKLSTATGSIGYGTIASKDVNNIANGGVGTDQSLRNKMLHINQMLSTSSINTSIRSVDSGLHQLTSMRSIDDENKDNDDDEMKISTADVLFDIFFGKGLVSLFLLAMPFAIASKYLGWSPAYVFWLNFIVMIPLASILGDFTEEVAIHTNETIGGLINASFGNAVEIIVAIQALLANEIRVVQASMIGSIFSNLLLVLGCCFFFGGLYHKEQTFNATAASANMGLLALSSIALVLPTPFANYYELQNEKVLLVSRVSALFLIFIYIQLLIFQLKTHAYLFDTPEDDDDDDTDADDSDIEEDTDGTTNEHNKKKEHTHEEVPSMTLLQACFGLFSITCMVALFSEYLVGSIEGFTQSSGISRTFVGVVLLPIVGNAVEHITAVTVAMKDKMDLAMGISLGSCTQISLFVAPLSVLLGWVLNKPMTLNFPTYEVTLYALAIFTVSVVCTNPRCNWLEGSVLVTTYALLALGFWFENVQDEN